jgi:hypothetical protein
VEFEDLEDFMGFYGFFKDFLRIFFGFQRIF